MGPLSTTEYTCLPTYPFRGEADNGRDRTVHVVRLERLHYATAYGRQCTPRDPATLLSI